MRKETVALEKQKSDLRVNLEAQREEITRFETLSLILSLNHLALGALP